MAHRLLSLCCFVASAVLIVLYCAVLVSAPVNRDAGFYLPVAQALAKGQVPYIDFPAFYTPLGMYIYSLLPLLSSGLIPFEWFMGVNLLAQMGCGFLVFWISSEFTKQVSVRWFVSLLSLYSMIFFEGNGIYLEPFVSFFSLLSVGIVLKYSLENRRTFFIAGTFAGLAFLCKQYGVLALIPLAISAISSPFDFRPTAIRLALIGVGAALPFLLLICVLCIVSGLGPQVILPRVFQSASYEWHPSMVFSPLTNLLDTLPFIVALPLLAIEAGSRSVKARSVLIAGALCYFPVLFVRPYPHYLILLSSFICLFWIVFEDRLSKISARLLYVCKILLLAKFTIAALMMVGDLGFWDGRSIRTAQNEAAKPVCNEIGRGQRVFVIADPSLYFICGFLPVDFSHNGFVFLANFSYDSILDSLHQADRVVTERASSDYAYVDEKLKAIGGGLVETLGREGFEKTSKLSEKLEIYEKRFLQ